jgi:hypothetical protein
LFGKTGNLIISFNGNSSQLGGDRMEIMESVEAKDPVSGKLRTTAIKLHEEVFFPNEPEKPPVAVENPPACTHCHGIPAHPIWTSYNNWDGAYGSSDDSISHDPTDYEGKSFAAFLKTARPNPKDKNQKLNPRYSQLVWPDGNPDWPYYSFSEYESQRSLATMPNARLNLLLSERNIQAYQSEIEKDSHYAGLKYQIPYLKFCDDPRARGKNLNPLEEFSTDRPTDLRFQTAPGIDPDYNLGVYVSNNRVRNSADLTGSSEVVLRMAVLDRLSETDPELRDALEPIRVNYENFGLRTATTYTRSDPEFLAYMTSNPTIYDVKAMGTVCQILKRRVDAEIAQEKNQSAQNCPTPPPIAPQVKETAETAVQVGTLLKKSLDDKALQVMIKKGCIDCHDPVNGLPNGPPMNFGTPSLLATDLKSIRKNGKRLIDLIGARIAPDASPDIRMPYEGAPVTPEERSTLMDYFRSLDR